MNRYKSLMISALAMVVLVLMVVLVTCQPGSDTESEPATATVPLVRQERLVGVCLPQESDAWTTTGNQLQSQLTALGYRVKVVYGDGTAQSQNTLLLELMDQGAACLVVAPVDSAAMAQVQNAALEKKVPILSYGSLLMDTEAVAGYICYDYQEMGASVARYIEEAFSLSSAEKENRSYTVELFMGAPEDYNAMLLHKGILGELEPYLTAGVLECKSHRIAFEDSCIPEWSQLSAEKSCNGRLKNSYPGGAPDICICASDSIAAGVISSLEKAGITKLPLVTGNGATQKGMENLSAGKQTLTVRTDPSDPAKACCAMVDMVLFGVTPDFNMGEVFNNVNNVPTALCGFTLVDNT